MWKRLLPAAPLLGTLLLLVALDLPEAHSAAGAPEGAEPPRTPYPQRERGARCHVCRLAEQLGLRMTPLRPAHLARCVPNDPVLRATAPRGRVRLEDVARLRVDLGVAFEGEPYVTLQCGDTQLGRVAFVDDMMTATVSLPEAVRRKLRGLRGRITWGRADVKEPQALASIWIDPPSARERHARASLQRALAREPRWVQQVIEAQLLLDQDLDHAAMAAARAVLARRENEPHAAAILQATHLLMGLQDSREGLAHRAEVIRPLRDRPWHASGGCRLNEPAPRLRSREPRDRGGCGG